MTSVIEITVLITFFSFIVFAGLTFWHWQRGDENLFEDEQMAQSWSCQYCGTVVEATTIENLIDGYRIHNESIYCPGEEEDEE